MKNATTAEVTEAITNLANAIAGLEVINIGYERARP